MPVQFLFYSLEATSRKCLIEYLDHIHHCMLNIFHLSLICNWKVNWERKHLFQASMCIHCCITGKHCLRQMHSSQAKNKPHKHYFLQENSNLHCIKDRQKTLRINTRMVKVDTHLSDSLYRIAAHRMHNTQHIRKHSCLATVLCRKCMLLRIMNSLVGIIYTLDLQLFCS